MVSYGFRVAARTYKKSEPLRRWLAQRSDTLDVVARGFTEVSKVSGPGRPPDFSKPLVHAYVLVAVREFQAFIRDLHDLAVERVVSASGARFALSAILTEGLVSGRAVDNRNPTHETIKTDFARIGLSPFKIDTYNPQWNPGDVRKLGSLIELRNALGHGDEKKLRKLLASGDVVDTLTWGKSCLPVLNRYAKSVDHLVWDHLLSTTGQEPWI